MKEMGADFFPEGKKGGKKSGFWQVKRGFSQTIFIFVHV
jgi:hypothetical protein